jgi:hypothetical protein
VSTGVSGLDLRVGKWDSGHGAESAVWGGIAANTSDSSISFAGISLMGLADY